MSMGIITNATKTLETVDATYTAQRGASLAQSLPQPPD